MMRLAILIAFALVFTMAPPVAATAGEGVSVKSYSSGKRATVKGKPGQGRTSTRRSMPRHEGPDMRSPAEGGDPQKRYEPGQIIVTNPPRSFPSEVRRLGFRILDRDSLDELGMVIYRVATPSGMSVPDAIRRVKGRFPGATVDANHVFDPSAGPSRAARKAHARGVLGWPKAPASCGSGVLLGMIDAPVDPRHPALKGQKVTYRSFHNKERKPAAADHGTGVAAMLVGRPEWGGLLPGATLKAANMFEINKTGRKVGNAKGLLLSLNWLAKNKVDVVNLSVAGADNKVLRFAFDKAKKKGMVMVAAAGNWGRDDKPAYPAAYNHVVAVTAVNKRKIIYRHANQGPYIEFAAPGVGIYTAVPGGGRQQSGTSFATPYVSALVALALKRGVPARTTSIRQVLQKFAVDLGDQGKDKIFGWGYLNMRPFCAKG